MKSLVQITDFVYLKVLDIYIYLLLGEYWWNICVCKLTDSLTHDVQPASGQFRLFTQCWSGWCQGDHVCVNQTS